MDGDAADGVFAEADRGGMIVEVPDNLCPARLRHVSRSNIITIIIGLPEAKSLLTHLLCSVLERGIFQHVLRGAHPVGVGVVLSFAAKKRFHGALH